MTQKITPFLWFTGNAEDAVSTYVSLVPNSRITATTPFAEGVPGAQPNTPMTIEFELAGQPFVALNGPEGVFGPSGIVSFAITCDDQAEVDRLWDALVDGGTPQQCGWLTDRWGITWQIVPKRLTELFQAPDKAGVQRVVEAMMPMVKLDIATLEKAYAG